MKNRAIWLPFTLLGLILAPGVSFAATEHDSYPSVSAGIPLTSPSGTEMIAFTGPVQFDVFFEINEGVAVDDDGNSREEVEVEITSLTLTGTSSLGLGLVEITLNTGMASAGVIEEFVNSTPGMLDVPPFTSTGSATMFLEAFYLVEIGGGAPLFNLDPIPLYTVIHHKPGDPAAIGTLFEGAYGFLPPFQLYESSDLGPVPTGYFLGVVPEPSSLLLLSSGVLGLAAIRRRRAR